MHACRHADKQTSRHMYAWASGQVGVSQNQKSIAHTATTTTHFGFEEASAACNGFTDPSLANKKIEETESALAIVHRKARKRKRK